MKIIHLEASPGWGGQEIRILRESKGMRDRGHEVSFVLMTGAILATRAREEGFKVYELNFRRIAWPIALVKLLSIFRKQSVDIVNTHSSLDAWIGGISARIARKKLVRTRHVSTPVKAGWNSRFVYGQLADFVVTTCEKTATVLSDQSGKPKNLFQSIPTGLDPKKVVANSNQSEKFREDLGVSSSDLLVGTACYMRSWKGVADLIHAADILRDQKDIKWVIIGGGHEDMYRKLAKDLKLEGIVHFTGHLDNPYHAIGALDIFTLLSTSGEGVSQAAMQAAFLKKPLITTPTGGLSEICLNGETGRIVAPFSPQEVAQSVLAMKENKALSQTYGAHANKLVVDRFTFDKTLDEMEKVFERVAALN
jgi:glycosyltransferase involved in cell wall biosynthesis